MNQTHDVIVVGAGPAGSSAARLLAEQGRDVLVLDKRSFPRDKLCAGLLTRKTMLALARVHGLSPEALAEAGAVVDASPNFRIRHKDAILSQGQPPWPFHFALRRRLDALLLDQARLAGAEVLEGRRAVAIDALAGLVRLETGEVFAAPRLIGADGASSVTRAAFPMAKSAWRAQLGTGLEIFLRRDDPRLAASGHEDLAASFPTVYAGFNRAGYAWTFPRGDQIALGLCGLNSAENGRFRRSFERFLLFLGLPADLADTARAHPLPYGNYLARPTYGRAMLVGDAAGLVECLFGEGIYYALRSGELAARAVLAAGTSGVEPGPVYAASLRREVLPELVHSRRLRRLIFSSLSLGFLPLRLFLRLFGDALAEMVHGRRSYGWLRPRPEDS